MRAGRALRALALSTAALLAAASPAHGANVAPYAVLFDPDRSLEASAALSAAGWIQREGTPSFGYRGDATWLRFDAPASGAQLFEIDNPWLDRLDVYFLREGRIVAEHHTGDHLDFSSRPVAAPAFVFPVPPEVEGVLVRTTSTSAHYVPLAWQTRADYLATTQGQRLLQGIYYGVFAIVLLYTAALSISTREPIYLFYLGHAAGLLAIMLSADGLGMQHLWPDTPAMQQLCAHAAPSWVMVFATLFANEFLQLRRTLPRMWDLLRAYMVSAAVVGVVGSFFESHLFSKTNGLLVLLGSGLLLTAAALRARQGHPAAWVYMAASGTMLLGGSAFAALQMGVIDGSLVARHGIQLGSTFELALFSWALSLRFHAETRRRLEVERQSNELATQVRALRTRAEIAEEHRQLHRSLQQAQKLKTIGELAGGFAHDFNNILASMLGFAELARDRARTTSDAKLLDFIGEIEDAGRRGAGLVRQLLVFSRGTPAEPVALDLGMLVEEATQLLRGTLPSSVRIDLVRPRAGLRLFADPHQIQQLLVNLTLNAAEASESRGDVEIAVALETVADLECASCGSRFSGEYAVLKVSDRGRGFAVNPIDLFRPYYTTKPTGRGSGLGLSVVHGIVHEHAGHVRATPRADGGSRFAVYLPLGAPPEPSSRKRILLIEDDAGVSRYLEALLDRHGYAVTVCDAARPAFELVLKDPDAFDLVIADQRLPVVTGIELSRDLRDLRPDLPVILCTADADHIERSDMMAAGIAAVFGKPIEADLLLAKAAALLRTS